MKNISRSFFAIAVIAALTFTFAFAAHGQRKNDRDVKDALRTLTSKFDAFDSSVTYQLRTNSADRNVIAEATTDLGGLRMALRAFQSSYDQKRETRDDVDRIVEAGRRIDGFLVTNPQNRSIQNDWGSMRTQIERLAANYGVTVTWNGLDRSPGVRDQQIPVQKGSVVVGLSGTYTLDVAKSESLDDAIGNINITADQRQDLKDKLEAPAQIAINIRGSQVTLASTNVSPVTVAVNGSEKTMPDGKGSSIRLKASLSGPDLAVSAFGGESDYTVTFTSQDDGRSLKVSRRITTDYLEQTVFAESVYNKVDNTAGLGIDTSGNKDSDVVADSSTPSDSSGSTAPITNNQSGGYSDNDQSTGVVNGGSPANDRGNGGNGGNRRLGNVTSRTGNFVVPNGETITGKLENEINTNASQSNDRFRITVTSPSQFQGAVIEGYISDVSRSGRVTGQANVALNFDKITFNGKTYEFAGNLQSIVDPKGKSVIVDSEGTIQGKNKTGSTSRRAGVGSGIGAVIGGIFGGGLGAMVGAAAGAGIGAGSVMIQGGSNIKLSKGSTVVVQSSSPIK